MNYIIRKFRDKAAFVAVCIFSALTAVPLAAVLIDVLLKGWRQINWAFFTQCTPDAVTLMMAKAAGGVIPGGIAQGIIGTGMMVGMASIISIPIGIAAGIFLYNHKKTKIGEIVSICAGLLQGVPSIVLGIIVYLAIVVPFGSYSQIAGAVSLVLMMLPLITHSTAETLALLPDSLREAGLTFGASEAKVMMKVILPSAMGGILTGIITSIARVVGETAPLMLTALGAMNIQWNPEKPGSAVSLLIWEYYNNPSLQAMIWSAALFLLVFVLVLNITAKKLSEKWKI